MWALADCNTFFASVERVFHPGLRGRPVVVLSNNDGIIVALTGEAKALGLHRGDPIFKVKDIVARNRVAVFSTNMMLYAAMSRRVQNIMRQYVSRSESYSIDEVFLNLDGYGSHYDIVGYMREMAERIRLWTDIPVGLAFEQLCLNHHLQIEKGLGISGITTKVFSWTGGTDEKAQIDLLIKRKDGILNVCEMKYYDGDYAVGKKEKDEIERRVRIFKEANNPKEAIHPVLVTTYGLRSNEYSNIFQRTITLKDLFQQR